MRFLALIGATLVLFVSSPAFATPPVPPLSLHAPALLGPEGSPAALVPTGGIRSRHFDHVRPNLLLTGLGLMAGGLIAGAAGFVILYYCDPVGTLDCADKGKQVLGWVLAAPGVLPLAIGSILVYISVDSRGGYAAAPRPGLVAFSAAPLPGGGGLVGTTFRF